MSTNIVAASASAVKDAHPRGLGGGTNRKLRGFEGSDHLSIMCRCGTHHPSGPPHNANWRPVGGWYDLACGARAWGIKEGTMTLRILAVAFAWLGLLLPSHVLAAPSFYVGVSGALMPQMFYFDASGGRQPISVFDVESIDGVGIGPGRSVYASTNVLGFGAIVGVQNARFSVPHGQSGGLTTPLDIAFGPDGNLYVVSIPDTTNSPGRVMRYSGRTGAFIDTFITAGIGNLIFPSDLLFQGDSLLISDTQLGVLRFDADTGAPLGVFIAPGSGAEQLPTDNARSLRRPVRQRPTGWPSAAVRRRDWCVRRHLRRHGQRRPRRAHRPGFRHRWRPLRGRWVKPAGAAL